MRILKVAGFILLMIISGLALNQYFFSPQITFANWYPFSGSKWYNPYANTYPSSWIKCNFHAHTNAWNGLTNGRGNAPDVRKAYDLFNYGIHGVSEYQKIDTNFKHNARYISAYEHGFNISKTHQLVLGAKHVEWLDFIYPQSLSNKQWILHKLSKDDKSVIFLNHPLIRNGYTAKDLAYLSNYHCIEVLNSKCQSFEYWDAALSAGKAVFIAGNDDTHNITNLQSIGRNCTWVNVENVTSENILSALREGKGYGMVTGEIPGEIPADRMHRMRHNLPMLERLELQDHTLKLKINRKAREISFIGQNGKSMKSVTDTAMASYIIKNNDTYIRTNILFDNGTAIYLNPVFRYENNPLSFKGGYRINNGKTLLFIIAGMLISLLLLLWTMRFLFGLRLANFILYWRHARVTHLRNGARI